MQLRDDTVWNYSYYPVLFESEETLLLAQKKLNEEQIFPRRYFYPSLNTVSYVNGSHMEISESVASRVLCLPLYKEIKENELYNIVKSIKKQIC